MRRALLAVTALIIGCGPNLAYVGELGSDGFHLQRYRLHVRADGPLGHPFLSNAWVPENYALNRNDWELRKDAPTALVSLDVKEGTKDLRQVPSPDLVLANGRDGARISLTAHLLPERRAADSLEVLVREMAGSLSGTTGWAFVSVHLQHHTSQILSAGALEVAGRPAYQAVIDVADTEALKLDPTSRVARVHVILVEALRFREGTARGRVLIELHLWAPPDKFDANDPDFERFARAVYLDLTPST
jgi:hypothetical protein